MSTCKSIGNGPSLVIGGSISISNRGEGLVRIATRFINDYTCPSPSRVHLFYEVHQGYVLGENVGVRSGVFKNDVVLEYR